MNCPKTLLAASIALLPLLMGAQAMAAGPMFGAPATLATPQQAASLVARLAASRADKGLDNDHGFAIAAEHPGVEGTKITRADHTYKGVRVFQSESIVVTDPSGQIVSESIAERRSGLGNGASVGKSAVKAGDMNVTPAVSADAAINAVVRSVSPNGVHHAPPSAELIIYPVMATVRAAGAENKREAELNAMDLEEKVTGYELAYLVKTRMINGDKAVYHDTIVSAMTGRTLKQWNSLQTVVGTGKSQYNGTVPISTTLSGTTYSMKDPVRGVGGTYGAMAITNANHTTSAGAVYTNSTNTWGDGLQYVAGGSTTNANGQTAAVNAMWGLMNTYDAMKNVLGWSSLDGRNTATYIAAHVNTAYDNAYYSDTCKCMYIGDGSSFTSLGSIDVIGHEMGHGVTAATSNLTYSGESGGLNESSSDINGEMIEAYARNGGTGTVIPAGNDWKMGVEISKTGTPLRYLYKPSLDGSSPNAWSSSVGGLDVHYSSGPNNRMFYFLSQGSNATSSSNYYSQYLNQQPLAMTGIGNDKAFRIWFKANTTKFTSSTNYADARSKVLAAANELYGVGSKEAIAVQRAYAAINVGLDVAEGGTPPPPPPTGSEKIVNGGFESSTTGWAGTTGVIGAFSGQTAYEGTRFAWLGGNGSTATETLTQAVAIPSTSTSASLSFALHIDTAETGTTVYDKLVVSVKNSSGTTLGTLATYSNVNKAAGYQLRTFDLSAYKGQTVTISFAMTEDSSLQTSFVVDKVSLMAN
ncbi:MAG: M4 family metallopeptidase [Bdellovibrionales bacterium]|nr:M4 family metallopeptidase [Massilia sp.]